MGGGSGLDDWRQVYGVWGVLGVGSTYAGR